VRQFAEKPVMQQALLTIKGKEELACILGISPSTLYQKFRDDQLIG
jgi:DNA-binding CsgD family transcriptional regulator